jgi:hypothetical protein
MMTMRLPWPEFGGLGAAVSPASGCVAETSSKRWARAMLSARAAGEQAVVTDAVEALRQDVDQESANELAG